MLVEPACFLQLSGVGWSTSELESLHFTFKCHDLHGVAFAVWMLLNSCSCQAGWPKVMKCFAFL